MLLDKKTLIKIYLNLGLKLTIFLGTGSWERGSVHKEALYVPLDTVDSYRPFLLT